MTDSKFKVDQKILVGMDQSKLQQYQTVFMSIDKNKDGFIDKDELLEAFKCLGFRDLSLSDIEELIKKVDINNNDKVEYQEFLLLLKNYEGIEGTLTQTKDKSGKNMFQVKNNDNMSYSTFSEEEKAAFAKIINIVLADDKDVKNLLPLNPETLDLFPALKTGIILCKLVNSAVPGTIDERVINKKENMNIFLCAENLTLALAAMKSIGIKVIGIDTSTILNQKHTLILGILWQLIKQLMFKQLSIKTVPEIIRLLEEGEEMSDLLKLPPEEILKRWFNYHLKKAGHPNKLNNFSSDLKDSEKYTILLNQLDPSKCDKSGLNEKDLHKRADKVLSNAKKLGAESYITSNDICKGNDKLNLLFCAEIFNSHNGLEPLTQEEYEAAKLLYDDVEGTREERAFRMWINSLGLDDVYVNNLYEDVRSGVLLLKVIDKIKSGSVNWPKVDLHPKNNFAKVVNCNEAIAACKKIPISTSSTAGSDINRPERKLILGIVWQLMRENTLQVLGNKTEQDIINWANTMSKVSPPLTSFQDKRLCDSLIFIDICAAIESRVVDWNIVKKDEQTPEAYENNAKYAISIARKLGAAVFLVWEDITEVKPKMCMTFVAGLYEVQHLYEKLKKEKGQLEKAGITEVHNLED